MRKARERGRCRRQGTFKELSRNFQDEDSLILQLSLSRIYEDSAEFPSFSKLICVQQQNGDGSKVTSSLKGLADGTGVNIQVAL